MELAGDLPVTLVVKAANQRVADQTVECVLGWTIRKLKQHLENVYPSKPKHHHQKLIYSGRLLADHLTLKEVLRQYDSENFRHTVHLVCSPSAESMSQPSSSQSQIGAAQQKSEAHPANSQSQSSVTASSSTESDGLRHRTPHTLSASTSTTNLPNAGANPAVGMPGAVNMMGMGMGAAGAAMPMMGAPGFQYTPEQMAWMQQMYSQYMMAQYMQYYGYQPAAAAAAAQQTPAAPVQDQPANQNVPNNARPNQNMRMNAQGGLEEDDEEFEQRDWLDYIYVFFRFLVLMSIVYFYSSASRFMGVALGFLVIYILQNGWFQRQQQQQQPAAPQPQQQEQQQQVQPQQQQQQENVPEARPEDENAQNTTEQTTETTAPAAPPAPPQPSAGEVFVRMITTFFTSLIPARPPAVNAN